jgi:hypothetical protein
MTLAPPTQSELAALVEKYERLRALRAAHARREPRAPREALRELAARFPGSLRELERATELELEERELAARRALEGHPPSEQTLAWALFHRVVGAALEARRREREVAVEPPLPPRAELDGARSRHERPVDGRLTRAALLLLAEGMGVELERLASCLHLRPSRAASSGAASRASPSGGEP